MDWLQRSFCFRPRVHPGKVAKKALSAGDWCNVRGWSRVEESLHEGSRILTDKGSIPIEEIQAAHDRGEFRHLVPDPLKAAVISMVCGISGGILGLIGIILSIVSLCMRRS